MNICVFSSSSNAISDIYFQEAKNLGQLIGEMGHTLVNGGANVGLMEEVTVSASKAGAKTIGIIPERFDGKSLTSLHSQEVIITRDMQERKFKMREISDAFISLPGGFGTLEEIMEVITLRQLAYHDKPIVFINTNNFYEHLFKQFDIYFTEKFIKDVFRTLYFSAENALQAMNYIKDYKPAELDPKWFVVPNK